MRRPARPRRHSRRASVRSGACDIDGVHRSPTTGKKKEGADFAYNAYLVWSAVISLATPPRPGLYTVNRAANARLASMPKTNCTSAAIPVAKSSGQRKVGVAAGENVADILRRRRHRLSTARSTSRRGIAADVGVRLRHGSPIARFTVSTSLVFADALMTRGRGPYARPCQSCTRSSPRPLSSCRSVATRGTIKDDR